MDFLANPMFMYSHEQVKLNTFFIASAIKLNLTKKKLNLNVRSPARRAPDSVH